MSATKIFLQHILIGLFIIHSQALPAQQAVTGRLTDATDGTPVASASVIVANTTIGVDSDAEGNFSFTVPGRGSFEIVVSHIGYQSVFHKIVTPQDTHQYNVELETVELDEIVVRAAKTYRQNDVNLFWRMILGETPSRRGMEVLNADKIYFYLNSERVLKASCREPVEIINHYTGYRIRYVLQSFEHDYKNRAATFYGMPYFEELVPQNSREQERWEKKRQEVYAVSMNRFLRALYRKQIHEEGFVLADKDTLGNVRIIYPHPLEKKKNDIDEINVSPFSLEDILQIEQGIAQVNIGEPLFLFCYSKLVTDRIIQKNYKNWVKNRSIPIQELLPAQIMVYSDGTYSGLLKTGEVNQYMNGLSSMVPVEYPEN